MQALGYDEYREFNTTFKGNIWWSPIGIQEGDLGYTIAPFMALKYGPKQCKAHHISTAAPAEPTAISHPELYAKVKDTPLTNAELAGLGCSDWFGKEGNGYYWQQATKPQTIGYSMMDSLVGLLAWICVKLHDWTDNYAWTDDEVLTWVSIYWFSTAGPAANNNIYYDNEHKQPPTFPAVQVYIDVPLGIARFPKDLILLPKLWHHTMGPILYESEHESGNHFAAWERPDAIVANLRAMFGKKCGAYDRVTGKNGYSDWAQWYCLIWILALSCWSPHISMRRFKVIWTWLPPGVGGIVAYQIIDVGHIFDQQHLKVTDII